jgi:DNA-binding NtrC family response regulator
LNNKVLIVEDQFVEANDLQIMLEKAGYEVCGIARSVEIAQEMLKKELPGIVLLDIFLKGKKTGIDLARQLKEDNIAFIYLSANSNAEVLSAAKTTEPYGFIFKPFREKDLLVMLEIAQYRHEHSQESKHRREKELIGQLEKILTAKLPWKDRLLQTAKLFQQDVPFDYISFNFDNSPATNDDAISFLRIGFNEYQLIAVAELATIAGNSPGEIRKILSSTRKDTDADFFNNDSFQKIAQKPSFNNLVKELFQLNSKISFPLTLKNEKSVFISFFSRRADIYTPEHISLIRRVEKAISKIIEHADDEKMSRQIKNVNNPGEHFNNNPKINPDRFGGIIGNSHLLLNVFDQITQVAPFNTAVLILGESGTGKERIADCIHNLSPVKSKKLVKVNCAALPATLIESELFGHEKGSFTGAVEKKIGKFERANGGTIFLDEIGEMPIDLQVKLLRVLQEKEIEPIGSVAPIKIDVRVIAATNRNLEKEVAEGRFRLDLYYRLNVFPIELPSLRERKEDIPALAQHFIGIYNHKSGKSITGLSENVIRLMTAYNWPGNIRELENLIERSVLMARTPIIEQISLPTQLKANSVGESPVKTIDENERDYIIRILKKCNGKVWGAGGAAELLNLPPSTLNSKMKKLGIGKADF